MVASISPAWRVMWSSPGLRPPGAGKGRKVGIHRLPADFFVFPSLALLPGHVRDAVAIDKQLLPPDMGHRAAVPIVDMGTVDAPNPERRGERLLHCSQVVRAPGPG